MEKYGKYGKYGKHFFALARSFRGTELPISSFTSATFPATIMKIISKSQKCLNQLTKNAEINSKMLKSLHLFDGCFIVLQCCRTCKPAGEDASFAALVIWKESDAAFDRGSNEKLATTQRSLSQMTDLSHKSVSKKKH